MEYERFAAEAVLPDVIRKYEQTLRAWSTVAGDIGSEDDARDANALFDEQHAYVKRIRDAGDGRRHLEGLLHDEDAGVRLMAAAQVLRWNERESRAVLAELARDETVPWAHAFSAQMTLREFDAGRLNFDY